MHTYGYVKDCCIFLLQKWHLILLELIMCIILSFHAWDHSCRALLGEWVFFWLLQWYFLPWFGCLECHSGFEIWGRKEGHWILLGDYARDFCCIHASNHLEHCFLVSVMVLQRWWYPPLWWFGCAWNAILDLNCVEDHWFCWEIICTPTTFVAFSCIRSFRALLWVTSFCNNDICHCDDLVVLGRPSSWDWNCGEGRLQFLVCIHLKHCLMSVFLQQLWRFDGSEYHKWIWIHIQWKYELLHKCNGKDCMEPEDPKKRISISLRGLECVLCSLVLPALEERGRNSIHGGCSVMNDHEAVAKIESIFWGKKI